MRRRSPTANQPNSSTSPTTSLGTPGVDGLEERLLAFADQLGRIARALQAKTAGWMDGDALKTELARVRDGAADLLQQLTADVPAVAENKPTAGQQSEETEDAVAASSTRRGRNIEGPCRPISARPVRTARRPKCARRKRWSRHRDTAGAAKFHSS